MLFILFNLSIFWLLLRYFLFRYLSFFQFLNGYKIKCFYFIKGSNTEFSILILYIFVKILDLTVVDEMVAGAGLAIKYLTIYAEKFYLFILMLAANFFIWILTSFFN